MRCQQVVLGEVNEWIIVNAERENCEMRADSDKAPSEERTVPQNVNHPFYMHTNHFQIVATSSAAGLDYQVGEFAQFTLCVCIAE
jgi:hypothetical protein